MPGFLKEFFPGDKLAKAISLPSASGCHLPPFKVSLHGLFADVLDTENTLLMGKAGHPGEPQRVASCVHCQFVAGQDSSIALDTAGSKDPYCTYDNQSLQWFTSR